MTHLTAGIDEVKVDLLQCNTLRLDHKGLQTKTTQQRTEYALNNTIKDHFQAYHLLSFELKN